MNFGKKIISVAAGVALVAGAGLAASTPVQAKAVPKTGGKTIIDFKPEIVGALLGAGISITATPPATGDSTGRGSGAEGGGAGPS